MKAEDWIKKLLKPAAPADDPDEWTRKQARTRWVEEMEEKWCDAVAAMDERCGEAVDRLSEAEFNRLFAEEQAKVDAIIAPVRAAARRDVWPKELYWGCI